MKKLIYLFAVAGGLFVTAAHAQSAKEQQAVKSLCGCFEVDFKYAETFASDTGYKFHPRYHVSALELAYAEETSPKKVVIQHLLVIDDTTVIKHWREDWEFEKSDWWVFTHDAAWKQVKEDRQKIRGQWTQTVWEVDDAPRYQGSSQWIASNNKYYWENTADAPLPRREYTKRNDYNVLGRTNRIFLTDTGYVHEQDNRKIVRKDGQADIALVEEKGYNTYKRTDDHKCQQAANWWKQHRVYWNTVRNSWEELFSAKTTVRLLGKVDGKFLFQELDELEQQGLTGAALKEKLSPLLKKYTE